MLFRLATNERLERVVKVMPGGEPLAWRAASHYVAGRSRADAIATAEGLLGQGHGVSIDLFGERVDDPAVAEKVLDDYISLANALPRAPADVWLSVDLSHLALGIDPSGAADRLAAIARSLPSRSPSVPGCPSVPVPRRRCGGCRCCRRPPPVAHRAPSRPVHRSRSRLAAPHRRPARPRQPWRAARVRLRRRR